MVKGLSNIELVFQIHNHRTRVEDISAKMFGEDSLVAKIMWWHDLEKWILLPFMFWHKNAVTKEEKKKARKFYTNLNKLGDKIFNLRFRIFGSYSEQELREAREFEKILDVIDRHLDPVVLREFKLEKQRPISDFLTKPQLLVANRLISDYESHWP